MTETETGLSGEEAAKRLMLISGVGIVASYWLVVNAPNHLLAVMYGIVGMLCCFAGMLGFGAWGMHGVLNPSEGTTDE